MKQSEEVMSNAELVKRLRWVRERWAEDDMVAADVETGFRILDDTERALQEAACIIVELVKSLKSKPTTEERRTWTRADGTTSPERTGEVDRRKSAHGDLLKAKTIHGGGKRKLAYSLDNESNVGRRSGDLARWTQPPAPECQKSEDGRHVFIAQPVLDSDKGKCDACGSPWHAACPPAPEVKQGLVEARASLTDEEVRTAIAIRNLRWAERNKHPEYLRGLTDGFRERARVISEIQAYAYNCAYFKDNRAFSSAQRQKMAAGIDIAKELTRMLMGDPAPAVLPDKGQG